jgi:hypothetical protein
MKNYFYLKGYCVIKKLMLVGIISTLEVGQTWSQPTMNMCDPFIRRYEAAHGIPHKLLTAISLAESGRKVGGSVVAWPWSINANGTPYIFATKGEAIRMVRKLHLLGITSIDVGCMQVNLKQHPKAFPTLEAAFDPASNIAYAAKFLKAKKEDKGSWVNAVAHYHSSTPQHHVPYRARVLKIWQKIHAGRLSIPQFLPEVTQTADMMSPLNIAKHKGELVKSVTTPSGRRLAMIVRFAPYKGFDGGSVSSIPYVDNRAGGTQIIRGRPPIQASGKIIFNTVSSMPSQKVFQIRGVVVPPKITQVSTKAAQVPLVRKIHKAKASKFRPK